MNRLLFLTVTCCLVLLGADKPAAGQAKKKPAAEPIKDKKLAGLVKDFKHNDPKVRVAALQELEQMAQVRPSDVQPAVPYVFPVLKDPDAGVRRTAVTVLDILEADPKQFVPPLVELLKKDKDPGVRRAAVIAAGHVGPPAEAAIAPLEAILKSVKDNPKEKLLANEVRTALQRIQKK